MGRDHSERQSQDRLVGTRAAMKRARRSARHVRARCAAKRGVAQSCLTLSDGTKLHYRERGTGPVVILLHGGMGALTSWEPQLAAIGRRFRVIAYSRRNSHPNLNPLRIARDPAAADAADLTEFMQALDIDRAHLVGTSYGALIALKFALVCPTHTLSLVLCEPPVHAWVKEFSASTAEHDRFMRDVWESAAACFRRRQSRKAMTILSAAFGGYESTSSRVGARSLSQHARAMKALALSEQPFARLDPAAVGNLRIPTLVLRGEVTDELHTLGAAELARRVTDCRTAVIAAAGHRSSIENPNEFNRVVLAFLESFA